MDDGALGSGDGREACPPDLALSSPVFVQILTGMEAVTDSVDSLFSARLSGLSDAESREAVRLFEQLVARVAAARLHLLADLDSRPGAVAGAAAGRVAQTFLVGACRVGPGQAAKDVAAARMLPVATAAAGLAAVADPAAEPCADPATQHDADSCTVRAPLVGEAVAPGSLLGAGTASRLTVLAGAFAAGVVSRAHVDVAVKAVGRLPSGLLREVDDTGQTGLAKVDAFLTEQARRHCPATLDRLVRHLVEVVDPDGAAGFDPHAYQRRSCSTVVDGLGMLVGRFVLDPAGAVVVASALDAFAAIPALGSAVDEDGVVRDVVDDRTREQRRADALVHIAQRAMTAPDAPVRAQVSVVATLAQVQRAARAHTRHLGGAPDKLTAAAATATATDRRTGTDSGRRAGTDSGARAGTGTGTTIDGYPGADAPVGAGPDGDAGPWLAHAEGVGPISETVLAHVTCDAFLTRLILSPAGAPLDVGRTLRLASAAQRRALAARDRGCVIPGCGLPATGCDIHHVIHWADGGATDLDNLVALCPRHHTAHHQGIWGITMRDGIPWVIPPPWIDRHQRPIRNTTHTDAARATRLGQHLRGMDRHPPRRAP